MVIYICKQSYISRHAYQHTWIYSHMYIYHMYMRTITLCIYPHATLYVYRLGSVHFYLTLILMMLSGLASASTR